MKKLEVVGVDKYNYLLKDNSQKEYNIELEFYDIKILPNIGSYIYMSENLLNKNYKEYSTSYCFGPLGQPYGRNIEDEEDNDILLLEIDNKKIYLQRYYG